MNIRSIFFGLILFSINSYCQQMNNYHHALREKNELGFKNRYRILKTTFKSLSGFEVLYPGTKISLEKVLRFHLHTSIHLDQETNMLISMDQSEFKLNNTSSEKEITKEVVSLIGNMFFGSSEVSKIPFEKKNY
tara:strand:- start:1577 stop:1978 length:402 start_codon:yes stop_codon:yes gene_type:complete